MSEGEFQLVRSAGFIVAAGIAIALQRWVPHAREKGSWRDNGALWAANVAVLSVACGACACGASIWARANGIGMLNLVRLPVALSLPLTVISLDLVSYAWHRANHRLALLWRFHQVHHSDMSFTVSTGVRFHPGELLLSLPLRLAAIAIVGAPVEGIVLFEVLFTVANLLEHGDIRLAPELERRTAILFITPALHRWHHSRRSAALNTNFGTIFVLWDRLFGSYAESSSAVRVETGLPAIAGRVSFTRALVLPWAPVAAPRER